MLKQLLLPALLLVSGSAAAQCIAPAAPTLVTASPSSICSNTGGNSALNATSAGNTILWYTTATGGTALGMSASAANFPTNVVVTTTFYAEAVATGSLISTTYTFTNGVQFFVVPVGVDSVKLEGWGAQGNSNAEGVPGGLGGYATGMLDVTAGDTLWVYVGGGNAMTTIGGYNGGGNAGALGATLALGGGGGGASDVRLGGTLLTSRVLVAGGGGGAAGNRVATFGRGTGGGGGGGYYGGGGGAGWPFTSVILPTGGTQTAGGIGGNSDWTNVPNNDGFPGVLGIGGRGGDEALSSQAGNQLATSGGVGGGTNGANGTYAGNFTGQSGGGGSGYTGTLAAASMQNGIRSGNGQVVITYLSSCSSTSRTPVTVTINPLPTVVANATPALAVCPGAQLTLNGSGATSYTWSGPVSVTNNTPFTAAAGTYLVTGTDSVGCSNSDSVTISIYAPPVLSTTASTLNFCAGDTVVLTSSGADTYAWSPTGGTAAQETVVPVTTTTYIVTGTDTTTGCSSSDSITLQPNALPVLSITGNSPLCAGGSDTLLVSGAGSYVWSTGGTAATEIVAPTTTTTYAVTGTDTATGCSSTDSVTVTVNALPEVSINAATTTICSGSSATLQAVGAPSYVWSTGGTTSTETVTPTSTTAYSVIGTDANGCSDADTVTITVNPLPTVALTLLVDTLCNLDGPYTLSGGSPAGGTWSGTAVSGSSFAPATAGIGNFTITYTYTDVNGCSNTATQNINVDACAGVTEVSANAGVQLYPNPAGNQLFIRWTTGDVRQLEVMDMTGRVVLRQQVTATTGADLDLSALPAGVYNLRVLQTEGVSDYRFIKN